MPILKRLTSREILRIPCRLDFEVVSMKGSHAKLVSAPPEGYTGQKEILVIAMHRKMSVGTIHAIYRQACRFIPGEELRKDFFFD